jgi:hypothetical protein
MAESPVNVTELPSCLKPVVKVLFPTAAGMVTVYGMPAVTGTLNLTAYAPPAPPPPPALFPLDVLTVLLAAPPAPPPPQHSTVTLVMPAGGVKVPELVNLSDTALEVLAVMMQAASMKVATEG